MIAGLSWIVVAIVVVVILMLLKFRHMKHRFWSILLVLIVLFFYLTATSLFAGKNVDLKSFTGLVTAGKVYGGWLWHAAGNVGDIAGNAIKMDWIGSTNSNLQNKTTPK